MPKIKVDFELKSVRNHCSSQVWTLKFKGGISIFWGIKVPSVRPGTGNPTSRPCDCDVKNLIFVEVDKASVRYTFVIKWITHR
jgi:hypothetical protein